MRYKIEIEKEIERIEYSGVLYIDDYDCHAYEIDEYNKWLAYRNLLEGYFYNLEKGTEDKWLRNAERSIKELENDNQHKDRPSTRGYINAIEFIKSNSELIKVLKKENKELNKKIRELQEKKRENLRLIKEVENDDI